MAQRLPPHPASLPGRPYGPTGHSIFLDTEAFLGKEEGSPSQTAVKASDAAHGELQSKEEQQHQKGSNRDSQSSAQHRNQGRVPAAGQGEPRLLNGAADSGSENPRPSPPSLTSSATQAAGHKRPAPKNECPLESPHHIRSASWLLGSSHSLGFTRDLSAQQSKA